MHRKSMKKVGLNPLKPWIKMRKETKSKIKKIAFVSLAIKIPTILYVVFLLTTIPAINAVPYDTVYGAHRGDSVEYIENTAEAIRAATENPDYQFIEFDIQYTKDKVIVVHHDLSLLRLQGKSDKVLDLTYDELEIVSDYHIPTYDEAMYIIGDSKKINIEIKSAGNIEDDKEIVDYVVNDCKEKGILANIMISSISNDVIIYVNEKYPEIKTGKIYWINSATYNPLDYTTKNLYSQIEELDADYLMLHGSNIHNINDLVKYKPEDVSLCIWYFNNEMYVIETEGECMW